MKKLLKTFCAFFALFFVFDAAALKMPSNGNVLGIKIFFLPKELNKEVVFTFFKRDNNGRAGTDALAFTVYSPSEKAVFEYTIPDDGNAQNGWKYGPRQEAVVKFVPTEKGVYTLEFKMECDAYLFFDGNRVENTYVGMTNGNFRTSGKHPAHLFFFLPTSKIGEKGIVSISSNYMHYSQITEMTITDGKTVFYDKFTADPAPDRRRIFTHNFSIKRTDPNAVYELTAKEFNLISFAPKLYPSLIFFFSKEGAEAFKPYLIKNTLVPNSFTLTAQDAAEPFALGAGESYSVKYIPAAGTEKYDFTVEVLGKTHRFTPDAEQFIIDVPKDNAYPELKITGKADGSFAFARVVNDKPSIETPVNAEVVSPVDGKIKFLALQVKGAKKYTFDLVHESGKKLQFVSDSYEFVKSAADFAPGVWQITCTPDNGKAGAAGCFAIKKAVKTTPVYLHGYEPAIDTTVKSVGEISVKTLCNADQIDLKKSSFTIGGKKYPIEVLGQNKIGIPAGKIQLADGKIDLAADIYDIYGNYTYSEWCFILNIEWHKTISFDKNGILLFNGRKFLPLICYPPHGPALKGNIGFNAILPNALTHEPQLDILAKNSMKSLDGGCVYHGYYTPKGSTPAQDIAKYLTGRAGAHPARLGAWLDESDAHQSDEKTRQSLQDFQKFSINCGVAGVCTTGRSRYEDMAKMGDYLMIDIYPRAGVLSVDYYFAKALRDAKGKAVWQLNQGFDYDWSNRDPDTMIPNPAMLKYAHWSAFRHGLQGLGLYMCGQTAYLKFPKSKLWQHVIDLYRNASRISFVLLEQPVKEDILTIAKPLNSRTVRFNDRYYLIVQNSSWESFSAELKVKGSFEPQVRVLFEDRVVNLKNGKFNDVFQGLESRVYELTVK